MNCHGLRVLDPDFPCLRGDPFVTLHIPIFEPHSPARNEWRVMHSLSECMTGQLVGYTRMADLLYIGQGALSRVS